MIFLNVDLFIFLNHPNTQRFCTTRLEWNGWLSQLFEVFRTVLVESLAVLLCKNLRDIEYIYSIFQSLWYSIHKESARFPNLLGNSQESKNSFLVVLGSAWAEALLAYCLYIFRFGSIYLVYNSRKKSILGPILQQMFFFSFR